jgi:hypothetical protein
MTLLSCKDTTRLVSQGLDRELAFGERVALRLHFAICLGCRRAGAQMGYLRKAVRELAEFDLKSGF